MLFYDLERMCGWIVLAGGFALSETGNTQVVVGAFIVGASDAYLGGHVSNSAQTMQRAGRYSIANNIQWR